MRSHRVWVGAGMVCLALLSPAAQGAGPREKPRRPGRLDEEAMARRIDHWVAAGFVSRKAVPAPLADDAEFVRRAYLDLAGRIPRVSEVRTFLADRKPDKRKRLVEKLLAGPHYVNHFSHVWRELLLPQSNNPQVQFFANQLESWVRPRLRDNAAYDKMVRELLTAPAVFNGTRARPGFDLNVTAFYQANELKPDNLAASTSRLFLGVKIECAQCHDHPFAKWKRRQFWEYAAFFGGLKPAVMEEMRFTPPSDDPKVHEIKLPNGEERVQAKFLDGTRPVWAEGRSARAALAEWMTAPDNPFFAKAAVNRMWEHFFGIGLVDPVDDLRDENPPSHPELLDELARQFVVHRYDLKYLIRAITLSKTYQRTSARTDASQEDLRLFARVPLKGLTAEQVFDSLATATGYREEAGAAGAVFFPGFGSARAEFLTKFANPVDRRTEHQTSILQALALMNGQFVADATSLGRSETLAAVLDSPFLDTRGKLDTLYLAALARPMRPAEASRLVAYVKSGGPGRDPKKALADVFWVLLNSTEFIVNH
jgi:hypothetical protein